jgi:hypothetical protein
MDIICYIGGTCGDLVTSVIDSTDSKLDGSKIYTMLSRSKLKSSLFLNSEIEQLNYIKEMESKYLSIPSHKIDLHIKYKHPYITIFTENYDLALWCANRYKNLNKPDVWENMTKINNDTIESYAQTIIQTCNYSVSHTDRVITLEDILSGNLLSRLSQYVNTPLNEKLYEEWLSRQD